MLTKKIIFQFLILFLAISMNAQDINYAAKIDSLKAKSNERYRQLFWKTLPKSINWTNDYENLFSDDEETKLNQIIANFEKETTIEIAIVTIDSFKVSKEKFEELTLHIAKTWGVGKKEKANGILIAISKGHRQIRIQNGDGILPILSDEETSEIIQNQIIPYFKKDDYFEGTQLGLLKIIDLLRTKLK